jgi:hypothetical protein
MFGRFVSLFIFEHGGGAVHVPWIVIVVVVFLLICCLLLSSWLFVKRLRAGEYRLSFLLILSVILTTNRIDRSNATRILFPIFLVCRV